MDTIYTKYFKGLIRYEGIQRIDEYPMSRDVLLKGIQSNPHNPIITNGFFRFGQIKAWGRGIEKMRNGCLADNLPEPEFEILPNMFLISFRIRNTNLVIEDGIKDSINKTQQKIVKLMVTNPEVTLEQLAEAVGIKKRNIEKNISKLKASGLVERTGSRKNGRWVVRLEIGQS